MNSVKLLLPDTNHFFTSTGTQLACLYDRLESCLCSNIERHEL